MRHEHLLLTFRLVWSKLASITLSFETPKTLKQCWSSLLFSLLTPERTRRQ